MTKILAICSLVAAGVGLADALIGAQADLAAVFATVLLLLLALLARLQLGRPTVAVRSDVAGWLRELSSRTGEPLEHLATRAIGAYRVSLGDGDVPGDRLRAGGPAADVREGRR